jgi:hypothetical protein
MRRTSGRTNRMARRDLLKSFVTVGVPQIVTTRHATAQQNTRRHAKG